MKKLAFIGLLMIIGLTTQAQHVFNTVEEGNYRHDKWNKSRHISANVKVTFNTDSVKIEWFDNVDSEPIFWVTVVPVYTPSNVSEYKHIIATHSLGELEQGLQLSLLSNKRLNEMALGESGTIVIWFEYLILSPDEAYYTLERHSAIAYILSNS